MGEELTLSGIYDKETSSLVLELPNGEKLAVPIALPFAHNDALVLTITTESRHRLDRTNLAKAILNEILST